MLKRSITGDVWLREMARHVGENLILARCASQDGKIHECARRTDIILRHHRIELIADAILWDRPRNSDSLAENRTMRPKHAISDILFGQSQNRSLRPIDGNVESRSVVRFLDPQVHQPGNLSECAQQLAGKAKRSRLDQIRRSGRRLARGIRNSESERRYPREETRLSRPETACASRVESSARNRLSGHALLQRHQDIAIGGADRACVVVRGIYAAVRKAEIIDDFAQLSGRE